jgi:hypothetical protein
MIEMLPSKKFPVSRENIVLTDLVNKAEIAYFETFMPVMIRPEDYAYGDGIAYVGPSLKDRSFLRTVGASLGKLGMSSTINRMVTELPYVFFMGFGNSNNLMEKGERLDMLNYFSAMSILSEFGIQRFTLWDASSFALLNRLSPKLFNGLTDAYEIVGRFADELGKRKDVNANCDLRRDYLLRLADISGISAYYQDARKILPVPEFLEAFATALEYIGLNPEKANATMPPNANAANRLYSPLEAAEAIYLGKRNEFAKFGGNGELGYDELIAGIQEVSGKPFMAARCSDGPRRPAYLADKEVLTTRSTPDEVGSLLSDQQYRNFVESYMQPFWMRDEPLEQAIFRMQKRLEVV